MLLLEWSLLDSMINHSVILSSCNLSPFFWHRSSALEVDAASGQIRTQRRESGTDRDGHFTSFDLLTRRDVSQWHVRSSRRRRWRHVSRPLTHCRQQTMSKCLRRHCAVPFVLAPALACKPYLSPSPLSKGPTTLTRPSNVRTVIPSFVFSQKAKYNTMSSVHLLVNCIVICPDCFFPINLYSLYVGYTQKEKNILVFHFLIIRRQPTSPPSADDDMKD